MRPGSEKPAPQVLNSLAKAFNFMKYDVALLTQDEFDAFDASDLTVDMGRKTAREEPFTIVETEAGDRIGFLRFPALPDGEDIPSEDLIRRIGRSIKNKRSKVTLLIGMSTWGWVGEREYLAQNPDTVPDMLFGSGRGSGVNGRIEANGRCVWVRPYDKGRTVSEVMVYTWPDHSKPFAWKEPVNIKSLSTGLGDRYPDNPEVGAILQ